MTHRLAILALSPWLALSAGASGDDDPPEAAAAAETAAPAPPPAAAPTAQTQHAGEPARPVKELTLDPNAKPPVCKRYVPTGSRIATERCQSAETDDAARTAERDQTRRDIDEMRMRQAARDQARAAAQAEALRRRAGF